MMERQLRKTLASKMQHYVYVQTLTQTADGEGGHADTWTDSAQQYSASIEPIQARQMFQYKSINVDATHIIQMRAQLSISEKTSRIKFGSRVFEILTIEDLQERGIVKFMTCREDR